MAKSQSLVLAVRNSDGVFLIFIYLMFFLLNLLPQLQNETGCLIRGKMRNGTNTQQQNHHPQPLPTATEKYK